MRPIDKPLIHSILQTVCHTFAYLSIIALIYFTLTEVIYVNFKLTYIYFYANITDMDIEIIKKAGLNDSQAKAYLTLIEEGSLTAQQLSERIAETRTNCYAVLDKLIANGLAQKVASTSRYTATHPSNLRKVLATRQRKIIEADKQVASIIPSLASTFHMSNELPGTIQLEGLSGVKKLYEDILRNKVDLCIITSKNDALNPDISSEITKQIARQRTAGIAVRALFSHDDAPSVAQAKKMLQNGIEAKVARYDSHAQIIIYSDTIAFSTFTDNMFTTLISHKHISETFKSLFELIWRDAQSY